VALVSFTSKKVWKEEPSLSDFVTELSILYKRPKYTIRVYYAFEAVYFSFVERKLYICLYSKIHNGWTIGFLHTSVVKRNYIPYIQEALNVLCNRRS
jgi:hypothetical protein